MLRRCSWIIVLTLFLTVLSGFGFAMPEATTNTASAVNARNAALMLIVSDVRTDLSSGWSGGKITILRPQEVADVSGQTIGYAFDVRVKGLPKGYVLVGNNRNDFPILSFSYTGQTMNSQTRDRLLKNTEGRSNERLISLGGGRFGLGFNLNGKFMIKSTHGDIAPQQPGKQDVSITNPDEASQMWLAADKAFGEIGTTSDGVTDVDPATWETGYSSTNRNYINGVPDSSQYVYATVNGVDQWTGCSPTSGSNVIAFWAVNSPANYGTLMSASQDKLMWDLRTAMHTFQTADGSGATYESDIPIGMSNYSHQQGYSSTSYNYENVTFDQYKNEINAWRPNIISVYDQSYYGDHSVTGVGYKEFFFNGSSNGNQFMVIKDNWLSTAENVYVAYGRNYSSITMTTFDPGPGIPQN